MIPYQTTQNRQRRGVATIELVAHLPALLIVFGLIVFLFRATMARIATLGEARWGGSAVVATTAPGPVTGLITRRVEVTRDVAWDGQGTPRPESWHIELRTTARAASLRPASARSTAPWQSRAPMQVLPRPDVPLLGELGTVNGEARE